MFLHTTNKLGGYHFKKIKSRAPVAVLRLVESEEDRAELVRRLDVVSERERQATAVIITREVERALTLYERIEFPIRLPPLGWKITKLQSDVSDNGRPFIVILENYWKISLLN